MFAIAEDPTYQGVIVRYQQGPGKPWLDLSAGTAQFFDSGASRDVQSQSLTRAGDYMLVGGHGPLPRGTVSTPHPREPFIIRLHLPTLQWSATTGVPRWDGSSATESDVFNIAVGSNSEVFAVGEGVVYPEGMILRSTDNGASWASHTNGLSLPLVRLFGVAHGDGRWVVVGDSGRAYSRTSGNWADVSTGLPGERLNSVAYGNGVWVVIGENSTAYQWTGSGRWTDVGGSLPAGLDMRSVTYSSGTFVALALAGKVFARAGAGSWIPLSGIPSTASAWYSDHLSARSGRVAAAVGKAGVYLLRGSTWSRAYLEPSVAFTTVEILPPV